jgi:hypothetical protein
MKTHSLIALSTLLLAALACALPQIGDILGTSAPAVPSNVLFQDDFSDPSSGWDTVIADEGITNYADGVYRIFVNTINSDVWANPGLEFSNVRIEVDANKTGGEDNNDFGLICRYLDSENFYFLIISSDGYYGIGKVSGGEQKLIGSQSMLPSELIRQGATTNRLRADCLGSKLSLYVNDQFLTQVEDADFTSGDVGLIAGSIDSPGVDIHFDNFQVLKP